MVDIQPVFKPLRLQVDSADAIYLVLEWSRKTDTTRTSQVAKRVLQLQTNYKYAVNGLAYEYPVEAAEAMLKVIAPLVTDGE